MVTLLHGAQIHLSTLSLPLAIIVMISVFA